MLKGFPIQRLPQVVFREVLKLMPPVEIIALYQTSRKSGIIVRQITRYQRVKTAFTQERPPYYLFYLSGSNGMMSSLMLLKICEEMEEIPEEMVLSYEERWAIFNHTDVCEAFRKTLNFLKDIFEIDLTEMKFYKASQQEINSIIRSTGQQIDKFRMRSCGLFWEFSEEIMDCKTIEILRVPKSTEELKKFFRNWMVSNWKFKEFQLEGKFDLQTIFNELIEEMKNRVKVGREE
ncbi:hypothetical protein GCK72_003357 [Caenorhabditis remanei]|uniref:F-box domain-containing protein n=1 Tax=Caenorhabditis remanei TaxID=31234 RepID=A0A6A5HTI4_CAERE|nr:hypothetical protein GCK72_003357 [Caenorhabditis remanei]KAF1771530.1 hypothetical protein GCK72_003357 [Caenorhabditis remanei]